MWAKFDDKYIYHPKLQEAGWAAQCVDMRAIIYCAGQETDGVVNLSSLPNLLGDIPRWRAHVSKLVEVNRWHVQGHDCAECGQCRSTQYVIHDFLKFNLSREKCDAEREKARERMARSREARSGRTDGVTSGGTSGARANGTGLSESRSPKVLEWCSVCDALEIDCECKPKLQALA